MRPYLLKGHERPLTFIKYNREGDLFISTAKDHHPTAWYADTGARLGTYIGHNGTCWTSDISCTASPDFASGLFTAAIEALRRCAAP
eukprot:scaffold1410_cov386-Prasinococcus_capsulatus_cf.AAC.2